MVDVAPQGETLAALAEVAAEADALGVTANPGETVAEVRVAEGEAPGPGGEGRTNAPEPERETRRRPPNPSAPPPRRRSSAPVVQARDDRGAPVRWVLGGVILGLALSGLSPEYSEPANSPEVHAHRDGAASPMAPGGFLPFGFRASAANRAASRDASAEEVIPFGGVPRTAEDARAALENRRSNRPIHPNTLHDEASEKVRVGSFRDRLARWVTSVVACASLFLPMSRSMARWPTPAFLLGVVAIVVFALSVNNALDVTANGSGWTRRHDQSPGVVLGTPLGTQRKHADIVAKIEVSNGPDGVIRVGAPTSRTTSRTNGVPRDGALKSRHHDVVTADSRRLASWGCEELTLWLKSEAGDWAGAYRERMCRLGMNADLLLTAEDADLRADLGVTSRMHRRALLAAAGKLRETLAHAAVRGDDAAAKVWIGRLDGDGPNDAGADADDPGVKPPSMDQSSNDSDSGYVLPGAIASLSRWRSVAPVHRTAQILGVANCPRLRMLRDVTIGDGSLAALAGIARLDGNGARALDKSLLALWFVSPGVLVTLRSHELWGLGSPAGGFGVVLGFALVAMWCHGMLEIATRFGGTAGVVSNTRVGVPNTRRRPRGGGRRSIAGEGLDEDEDEDDSSDTGWSRDAYPFSPGLESAAYLVLTRCVYPGAARALMLEAASLTMHATHSCLVDAVFIVGGVGLPLSRVGYRCWYVSSRGRGSQFWSDLRHVVRARVGLGGSGDAHGGDDLGERARGPREAWASGDDWAEIAYGYAREDDSAINNSSAADEATDTSIMVDDIAVSNSPDRSSEETRGGDGRRRDTVDADQVRAMTVEAMERIIFGPVGDLDRSLDVLEDLGRGHARGTDGQGANTRDAGTGAGSVTTHTTATATGVGAGVATGTETVLLARDVDRARSSRHSSSSSASRSHWPGPVQLPEWINEERAPSHFKCPITLCVMREPAVTPAGITYERSALMQWLDHQHVEPSTKRRLKRSHVVPNLTLRAMIEDWLQHERDVRSGKSGGGGVDGSSGGRIDNHGGLPPGAAAVLQADRDALRAVRQRMYAALKERAAMGVCYEEQRWEAYRENRNREEGDGTINPEGQDVEGVEGVAEDTSGGESGSGSTSPERIRVLQSARVTGAHRTRLASVFGPELPAEPSNQSAGEELTADPPGSLDATLDDAAMND